MRNGAQICALLQTRTTGYTYDKVGNRKGKTETAANGTENITYSYDTNDRLTQEEKTTVTGGHVLTGYTWDANGNLSTKTVGASVTVYLWNGDGRLVEVKQGSAVATAKSVALYIYDAQGIRIGKNEPGVDGQPAKLTTYVVDGTFEYAQTVQENVTQGAAAQSTNYVWGAGLIEQVRGDQAMSYHADSLGSIKALSDAGGVAKDTYEYDAFGAFEGHTGTTENGYRYTGEYFDDSVGLQYNRERWLDLIAGRFVSQDAYPGANITPVTLNKYIYANSDAVNVTDPSGQTGLMDVNVANKIAGTLNGFQINFGFDFGNAALTGEGQDLSMALGILALGGAEIKLLKLLSKNARNFFAIKGLAQCETICVQKLGGRNYEEFLHNVLGLGHEFQAGGKEFDGWIGGVNHMDAPIWYEAKSASVWVGEGEKWISDLKNSLGSRAAIAKREGKEFRVLAGGPISESMKAWMEKKGIVYIEAVD